MSRRTIFWIAILALAALAVLIVVCRQQPEPVARGRPLSYWITGLYKWTERAPKATKRGGPVGPRVVPQPDFAERQTARAAIKEMGTNALPELTRMLRRHDPPMRKYLVSWVSSRAWLKSRLKLGPSAEEDWCRALDAIACLGPVANPALPEILPLMTNQNFAIKIRAFFAMTSISPETEVVKPIVPTLLKALGDQHGPVRSAAIYALAALRPEPPEAAPAFVQLLNDANGMVREAAMNCLVAQTNAVVIPVLDKQLRDNDSYVVGKAASQIATFGAAAAGSVPRLKELLNDPLLTVRQAAGDALTAITGQSLSHSAPEEKADITLNFQGMPLAQFLDFYEGLAGKKVAMVATPKPGLSLRVQTPHPLTKSEAMQLFEELLKEQAGLVIVHRADGSLSAVAKP